MKKNDSDCRLELLESDGSTGRFQIKGKLDFESVIALNLQARKLFRDFREIIIDLSEVSYVNSAGLALLLDWKCLLVLQEKKSLELLNAPLKLLNLAQMSEIETILSI